jgi:hypothetical protein
VTERLLFVEQHGVKLARFGRVVSESEREWCETGDAIGRSLASALHGELDPRSLDEAFVRQWQMVGRHIERTINRQIWELGREAKRNGFTAKEGANAALRGEWKPLS